MRPELKAHGQLVLGAVILSTGAAAVKASGLDAWALAGWRGLVIVAFLALLVRPARRCWTARLLPAALAHAVTTVLFMWANKLTTAATAIFLQYTAPLYVLLLAPWLLQEPVSRRDYAYAAILLAGLALLLANPATKSATATSPLLGGVIAAVCGITWGLSTLTMRELARDPVDGFARTIASIIVANLALAVVLLPIAGDPAAVHASDWGIVIYMGVLQLGTSFLLISLALRRVTALEGTLVLLLEPVLNPLWAWLLHGEEPGMATLGGGAVILGATLWRTLRRTAL